MSYRADKLVIETRTHRPTVTADDKTRRPKLASSKNPKAHTKNQNVSVLRHTSQDTQTNSAIKPAESKCFIYICWRHFSFAKDKENNIILYT